jgi:FixJ family two-component response regulator
MLEFGASLRANRPPCKESEPMKNREAILYPTGSEARPRRRREEVLLGIWAGKPTKQIAADLGVSPKTVEYHERSCIGCLEWAMW